jgi:hypothetical protein
MKKQVGESHIPSRIETKPIGKTKNTNGIGAIPNRNAINRFRSVLSPFWSEAFPFRKAKNPIRFVLFPFGIVGIRFGKTINRFRFFPFRFRS